MGIYFTSDLHLGHENIIEHCRRPFADVRTMNEVLIHKWNATVGRDDEVYILGDLILHVGAALAVETIWRLDGKKHLIVGNHDQWAIRKEAYRKCFESISDFKEIKVPDPDAHEGKRRISLMHYAMRVWPGSHHGTWHLYGHSHGKLEDDPENTHRLSFDVGVDCHNFAPISYEEVKAIMREKHQWQEFLEGKR